MKGHYRIEVRRRADGVRKVYNFNNKLTTGFHHILSSKMVTTTTDSVIDTLWLADGMGQHAPTATTFIGSPVAEMKYTDYIPPTNLDAVRNEREFINTFIFTKIIMDMITVGEVGVGTYIDDELVLASLTFLKDLEGNPVSITLLPGDELTITWTLLLSTPPSLTGITTTSDYADGTAFPNWVSDWSNGYTPSIDFEMFNAYPNWQLCGYKRICDLILARNKIITNTDWAINAYAQRGDGQWELRPVQFNNAHFGVSMYMQTNKNTEGYVLGDRRFIPCFLAPVVYTYRSGISESIGFKLLGHDYYKVWSEQYGRNLTYPREVPTRVSELSIVQISTDPKGHNFTIYSDPYVMITLYRDKKVYQQSITDAYGILQVAISIADGLNRTLSWHVKAYIPGHQLIQAFVIEDKFRANALEVDFGSRSGTGINLTYYIPAKGNQVLERVYVNNVKAGGVKKFDTTTSLSLPTGAWNEATYPIQIANIIDLEEPMTVYYTVMREGIIAQELAFNFNTANQPTINYGYVYIPNYSIWPHHKVMNDVEATQERLVCTVKQIG